MRKSRQTLLAVSLILLVTAALLWAFLDRGSSVAITESQSSRAVEPPPVPQEAAPPDAETSEETSVVDNVEAEDAVPPIDLSGMLERDFHEKLEAARKDLHDRLSKREEIVINGLRMPKNRVSLVSNEEKADILKEFLDSFSPVALPEMLSSEQTMLAQTYFMLGRVDDARKVLDAAVAKLDGRSRKDTMIISWARWETSDGDPAFAEKLLADLIASPIPPQPADWVSDNMETVRRLEAPLLLANLYRDQLRVDESLALLEEVTDFALSLKDDHQAYANMGWFYGRACQARIGIIFDRTNPSDVDAAFEEAGKIVKEYETTLSAYRSNGGDHRRKYVDDYVERLRKQAQDRAEKMREEDGPSDSPD